MRHEKFAQRISVLPQKNMTWICRAQKHRLLTGACLPSYDSLTHFVRAMGVSADYLLGLIDEPIPILTIGSRNQQLWERIGTTQLVCFSPATLERLGFGYLPNSQILIRIAKEMNVSIDHLIDAVRITFTGESNERT
jgi:hypothetical protein